jgi:hypothetical protein
MAIRLFQCSSAARLSGQRPAPVPIRHHFNRSTLGPFNPSALQPFPPWPRPALVAGLQPTPAATNVPRWATATMPGTSGPVLSRCARSRAAPPTAQRRGCPARPRRAASLAARRVPGRWPAGHAAIAGTPGKCTLRQRPRSSALAQPDGITSPVKTRPNMSLKSTISGIPDRNRS